MFYDAVNDRVAEVHIGVSHIYLGTQHHSSFFYFSIVHFLEQFQIFFNGTVAVRTFHTRLCRCTFLGSNLFAGLFVDVCFSFFNQPYGKIPKLLEVVGSIIFVSPLISQPLDIFLDGFYIFYIFFSRVGVVKAEIGLSAVLLGEPEVDADAFRVSEMEVPVRLRRETCHHALNSSGLQVVLYYLLKKVESFRLLGRWIFRFFHCSVSIKLTKIQKYSAVCPIRRYFFLSGKQKPFAACKKVLLKSAMSLFNIVLF